MKYGSHVGISTVEPDQYGRRFLDFMNKIIEWIQLELVHFNRVVTNECSSFFFLNACWLLIRLDFYVPYQFALQECQMVVFFPKYSPSLTILLPMLEINKMSVKNQQFFLYICSQFFVIKAVYDRNLFMK